VLKSGMLNLACVIHNLTWNQKNQLTHVSGAAAGPIEYRYDAMGRRVQKIVNSVTTNYLYDGLNLIAELDGDNNNAVKTWYVYAGPMAPIDRPLARVDASDGSVLYYHQDLLGSVIALTNSSGVVVTQYNYSPFGHTEVIGTDIDQPFRFTGREWDAETGLYYYRARYYSPDMRRFISEDPIRFEGGDVNFYAYVGGNPVNFSDPLGLLNPIWHFIITNLEAVEAGYGPVESIVLATKSVLADLGNQTTSAEDTKVHAMAGEISPGIWQTPEEAICSANNFIDENIKKGNLGLAVHTAQDLATPVHAGVRWTGDYTFEHAMGDLGPTEVIIGARRNTRLILKK
jgi:RHS repeat-associated protein